MNYLAYCARKGAPLRNLFPLTSAAGRRSVKDYVVHTVHRARHVLYQAAPRPSKGASTTANTCILNRETRLTPSLSQHYRRHYRGVACRHGAGYYLIRAVCTLNVRTSAGLLGTGSDAKTLKNSVTMSTDVAAFTSWAGSGPTAASPYYYLYNGVAADKIDPKHKKYPRATAHTRPRHRTIVLSAAAATNENVYNGNGYHSCWSCGAPAPALDGLLGASLFFCEACGVVRQPPAVSPPLERHDDSAVTACYFAILGMPEPSFDVDLGALETAFRDLQRRLHPDKFSMGSAMEQQHSAAASALVNKAYVTLCNNGSRANYMLGLRGRGVTEADQVRDPELIMMVMELNEELEEADEAGDADGIEAVRQRADSLCNEALCDISDAFASKDDSAAEEALVRLRYFGNIVAKVDENAGAE